MTIALTWMSMIWIGCHVCRENTLFSYPDGRSSLRDGSIPTGFPRTWNWLRGQPGLWPWPGSPGTGPRRTPECNETWSPLTRSGPRTSEGGGSMRSRRFAGGLRRDRDVESCDSPVPLSCNSRAGKAVWCWQARGAPSTLPASCWPSSSPSPALAELAELQGTETLRANQSWAGTDHMLGGKLWRKKTVVVKFSS